MIMKRILIMMGMIVLLTLVMLGALTYSYTVSDVWTRADRIIQEEQNNLKTGRYERLAASRYLQENDALDVVDAEGNILYSSTGRTESYDAEYLSYIPEHDKYSSFTLYSINDHKYLLINDDEEGIREVMVLDEEGSVLYTSRDEAGTNLSEKTMELLQENQDIVFQKYTFTADDGNTYYLLLHLDGSALYEEKKYQISSIVIIAVYVAGIILTVLIGGYTLARKVTGPIHQLEEGMQQFSSGSREPLAEIKGPKEVVSAVHTFNDMNETIVRAEEENRTLVEQKRRITADLSHDLKTPVTVVQGYIDAMRDGLIPPEEYPKYLKIMSDKTGVLAELIDQISTYNRLDHPDVKLHFQPDDMSEFVRSYFAGRYSELEAEGHEIIADIPDEKIMVNLDRTQMNRVLDNLVNNSLKHAGREAHFFVVLRKENGKAVLRLGDDGKGIDPQLAPHIFEPFIMGDASRTAGSGSGLGLAIAHSIITKHQGTIVLAEQKDIEEVEKILEVRIEHGTLFRIELPVMAER
jgi:signal transduction histidine kinase